MNRIARTLLTLSLVGFVAGCSGTWQGTPTANNTTSTGTSTSAGQGVPTGTYSYTAPTGWHQLTADELAQFNASLGHKNTSVTSAAEDLTTPGSFHTNVTVEEEHLDPDITLEMYQTVSIDKMSQIMPGATMTKKPYSSTLGGTPAYVMNYQGTQQGRQLDFSDITAVRDHTAYNVTMSTTPDHNTTAQHQLTSVIRSWHWTNPS